MKKSWFVLQTKPCLENQVQERLEYAGFESFLPKLCVAVRGVKKLGQRIRPLFPSYLFVRLDFSEGSIYHKIKYTRGVRRIVGAGDVPLPVDDAVVDVIKGRVDSKGILEQQFRFKEGDSVRISYGPLTDLVGVLEKPVSADGRVRVLLNLIGKRVHLELPCVRVEKVA